MNKTQREAHPYFMYDHIHAQPQALRRVLDEEWVTAKQLAQAVHSLGNKCRLHIVGIGTSNHACMIAEQWFRTVGGFVGGDDSPACNARHSFEFSVGEGRPTLSANDVVIIVSHRGTKQYSGKALAYAQQGGALTVLITGIGSGAKDTDNIDYIFKTCEQEKSSAHTFSYTSSLMVLLLLATEVGILKSNRNALELAENDFAKLRSLPDLVQEVLHITEPMVKNLIPKLQVPTDLQCYQSYFVGYGQQAVNSYEVALKLKETCYIKSEGFQLEQFYHGPFCAVHPGNLALFMVVPPNPCLLEEQKELAQQRYDRCYHVLQACAAVQAKVTIITQQRDANNSNSSIQAERIVLPDMHDAVSPILYVVPLQLLTYWMSVELKSNPDCFRLDNPLFKDALDKFPL